MNAGAQPETVCQEVLMEIMGGIAENMLDSMENNSRNAGAASESRIVFIVNPVAGTGRCMELFAQAEAHFKAQNVRYRVLNSEYSGHSVELAKQAIAKGERFIVAVGGDGTVNEVVSAVYGVPDLTFGILPFGTGNDFASSLNIPTDPEAAAALLLEGQVKRCDLGLANGRVFTNVCGLGFDVDVLQSVEKNKKGKQGMLPYIMGIVGAILHRSRIGCRIKIDDNEEIAMDALIITACNGRRFGGGMLVAPEAKQDDGVFDICIAHSVGLFRLIGLLPKFVKGKHIDKKPVIYTRGRKITVQTDGEFVCEVDGELILKTPLTCEVLPGALPIIRP